MVNDGPFASEFVHSDVLHGAISPSSSVFQAVPHPSLLSLSHDALGQAQATFLSGFIYIPIISKNSAFTTTFYSLCQIPNVPLITGSLSAGELASKPETRGTFLYIKSSKDGSHHI